VVADAPLPVGTFVCEYAGELLRTPEADVRLKEYDAVPHDAPGHALLVGALYDSELPDL